MSQSAHLEVVVTSSGIQGASKDLRDLTAYSKETEKQQQHLAGVFAEMAAAEEKEAAKAVAASAKKAEAQEKAAQKIAAAAEMQAQKAAQAATKQAARENEQWNDAIQKAIARNEKRAESAERAAKREAEAWNNAIQRAKAGLDGVLPIRPSLQRIEARVNESSSSGLAGVGMGLKEGAIGAFGLGALAGGGAAIGSAIAEGVHKAVDSVIELSAELGNLRGRIAGVTGDAESANEKFEELESMTLGKLPSTVREVSEAFVFLGNTGLNNSREALKSYSNIAAQTGHSLGDVAHAVELASQGNYRSLREYGIKVKEEGDNLQVTFRGQTETIAHSSEAIEGYMQSLGNVEFAGAVDRQMDTIGGAVKRTHDAWEKLITTVADSSLGSLIESTVGASTSVIDAMTASVDALFDKVHKGRRELEADKARVAEENALNKTMAAWADPSASRSEIEGLAARLAAHEQSSSDKALAQYTKNEALIARLETLGEENVGDMTLSQARNENERQYRRDAGGDKQAKEGFELKVDYGDESRNRYLSMVAKQNADELAAVHEALNKKEDSAREFYEHNKALLEAAKGDRTADLLANETEWSLHLAKLADMKAAEAAASSAKEAAFQKKIGGYGRKPESGYAAVNFKYAGMQTDLKNDFGDKLSADPSNPFVDPGKLEAEQQYKEKSVEIEKARAREIDEVNKQLVANSLTSAEATFGGLANAMKRSHGEQSAAYKTMFAMQKTFGLASAEAAMMTGIAKAWERGWPEGIPAALGAAAEGAKVISELSSLSYSGAYDSGGNIPAGTYGDVGERRPELLLVGGRSQVQGPATVIGGAATAGLLGGGQSPQLNVRVVNAYADTMGAERHLSSTAGEHQVMNIIRRNASTIGALR